METAYVRIRTMKHDQAHATCCIEIYEEDVVRIELQGMSLWIIASVDEVTIETEAKLGFLTFDTRQQATPDRSRWRIGAKQETQSSGALH